MEIRPIAFYLPQYHPIPENDAWWGKGFTEWTNVAKAKPLYKGHHQPQLPADLGFYDIRIPEIRQQQADLAKEAGIHGFCYFHYWFNGKRLLERPFNEVLASAKPDFPFMLCWANENWTRRWDGGDETVLMKQEYGAADAREHLLSLLPAFNDKRYIRINNKPVFVIYRSTVIPDLEQYIEVFREEALKNGLELYLCRTETFGCYGNEYLKPGFDAAIEFQPFHKSLDNFKNNLISTHLRKNLYLRIKFAILRRTISQSGMQKVYEKFYIEGYKKQSNFFEYTDYVDFFIHKFEYPENYKLFPGVTPSWDNSPRRGKDAFLFKNARPEKYAEFLAYQLKRFKPPTKEENLLFINAWNEWGEGNYLEPSQKWGKKYLEVTKKVIQNA